MKKEPIALPERKKERRYLPMLAASEKKIPFFNFLLTLAVAVYHCNLPVSPVSEKDTFFSDAVRQTAENGCILAMSFFFFVSAYLLFRTFTPTVYFSKLRRRVFSLFLPFLLWNLFAAALHIGEGKTVTLSGFLKSFLLLGSPEDGPLWYMEAIFLLAVISPLFYLLFKNKRTGGVLLVLSSVFFFVCLAAKAPFYVSLWTIGNLGNVFYYFPCYLTGIYCGLHGKTISDRTWAFCGGGILFCGILLDSVYAGSLVLYLLHYLPVFLLVMIPEKPFMRHCPVYRISFFIYALHFPFYDLCLPFLSGAVSSVFIHAAFYEVALRLLCLGCVAAVSAVFYLLLSRFCPPLLSVLTGGRVKSAVGKEIIRKNPENS